MNLFDLNIEASMLFLSYFINMFVWCILIKFPFWMHMFWLSLVDYFDSLVKLLAIVVSKTEKYTLTIEVYFADHSLVSCLRSLIIWFLFIFFLCIFPFYISLFFGINKGVALAPTYPRVRWGNQTYVVL